MLVLAAVYVAGAPTVIESVFVPAVRLISDDSGVLPEPAATVGEPDDDPAKAPFTAYLSFDPVPAGI